MKPRTRRDTVSSHIYKPPRLEVVDLVLSQPAYGCLVCKHGVVLLTEMKTLPTVKNMLVKKFVYLAMGVENALNLQ